MTLRHSVRSHSKIHPQPLWILRCPSFIWTKLLDQLCHHGQCLPTSTSKVVLLSSKLLCNLTHGAWPGYPMTLSWGNASSLKNWRRWIGNANWKKKRGKSRQAVSKVNVGMHRLQNRNDDPTDMYFCVRRELVITTNQSKYQVVEFLTNYNNKNILVGALLSRDEVDIFNQVCREHVK